MGKVKYEPPKGMPFDYKTAVYADKCMAINEVIKRELTEPLPPVRLGDIKLTSLKTIIKSLKHADEDLEPIKKAYLDHIDAVKAFILAHDNYYLNGTKTYEQAYADQEPNQMPVWDTAGEYKHLEPYFEPYELRHEYTDGEIENQRQTYERFKDTLSFAAPPAKKGEYATIKGVRIKDLDGLREAIKKTIRPKTTYALREPDYNGDAYRDGLDPVYVEISKLNQEVGIKPSGGIWARQQINAKTKERQIAYMYGGAYTEPSKDPNIITTDLRMSDRVAYVVLLWALVKAKENADRKASQDRRLRSNLKDGHDGLPRPATTTLGELFESATINSDRLMKIYDNYRTPEALQEAGGYKVRATQQLLPLFKASNDYKTLQEMIQANIPTLEKVLITVLREAIATGGINTEPRWSKIGALARPMFEEQIAKRGKLETKNKLAYIDNLHLLEALQFYKYEKPSKRNEGGGIYRKFKFIEIIRLDVNKKKIPTHIEWRLTPEFTEIAPELIFVNVDNFLKLQSPHAQMLATYVNDSFVMSEKRTNETIAGLPIAINAKTLADKAGLSKSNITDRYTILTDSLNQIKEGGIIEKWATDDGSKVIRSKNNKLPKITIYPSKNVSESYISPKLNASLKQSRRQETAQRQAELKKLLSLYRKDFGVKKDTTAYKEALAEDLKTTVGKIDLMLLKPTKVQQPDEIDDDMLESIRELLSGYEQE